MEDDFGAENLEDGELWLPSDFFSTTDETNTTTEVSSPILKPYCMHQCPNSSSSAPFLDRHCCTFSEPAPAFQRFKPAVRVGYSGDVAGHDFRGGLPVHRYQRLNPVQNFMGERERAWSFQNRFAMNRVSPGLGMGGYRGTGVFLPRVVVPPTPTANVGINQKSFRKGQGKVDKHEIPPRKVLLRRKQEECRDYITA